MTMMMVVFFYNLNRQVLMSVESNRPIPMEADIGLVVSCMHICIEKIGPL